MLAACTAIAAALTVFGCASTPEDTSGAVPDVETQAIDPTAKVGTKKIATGGTVNIDGISGGFSWEPPIMPGGGDLPPISCGDECTPSGIGCTCPCPHGYTYESGVTCPWGTYRSCFNGYCGCVRY